MPEGHILHRLARLHQRRYVGGPVAVSSPQGRFASGAAVVDGRVFESADAWGKHLFHHYANGPVVHVHLGIYGAFSEFTVDRGDPDIEVPGPVGQVRMRMVGTGHGTDLRGPSRCEVLDDTGLAALLGRLGPDPLRDDAVPEQAWVRIAKSTKPIAALLLDQSLIAGVGNVYRSEVLFRRGIAPQRSGNSIAEAEFVAIWDDLTQLMKVGAERGNIVVVRPEDDHGAPAYAPGKPRTYVYRRAGDPCRVCGAPVRVGVIAARNAFWCPDCQP